MRSAPFSFFVIPIAWHSLPGPDARGSLPFLRLSMRLSPSTGSMDRMRTAWGLPS